MTTLADRVDATVGVRIRGFAADDLGDGLWSVSFCVANQGEEEAILAKVLVEWSDGSSDSVRLLVPLALLPGTMAVMAFPVRHETVDIRPVGIRLNRPSDCPPVSSRLPQESDEGSCATQQADERMIAPYGAPGGKYGGLRSNASENGCSRARKIGAVDFGETRAGSGTNRNRTKNRERLLVSQHVFVQDDFFNMLQ